MSTHEGAAPADVVPQAAGTNHHTVAPELSPRALSRRAFLAGSAAAVPLLAGLPALAATAEPPMLAPQVAAGTLPPLAQRLPKRPIVVQPIKEIGRHGGTWRMVLTGSSDDVWIYRTVGYENMLRWDPAFKEIIPNVAESVTANANATVYTFKLREGLRWSDGQPFTAEDVRFALEEVLPIRELGLQVPGSLRPGNVTFGAIDAHSFTLTFRQPAGLFMDDLAQPAASILTRIPKHYVSTFMPKYNPQAEEVAKARGARSWMDHMRARAAHQYSMFKNPELPTLHAWVVVDPYDGAPQRVTFRRNPYYFKVDPRGQQLPYIDTVTYQVVQDAEVTFLKAVAGEVDFQWRRISTPKQRPVLVENMKRGNYTLHERTPTDMNHGVFYLNLTHKDPVKRALYQNKDFRIGLSHAIDRQEIIDAVLVEQGEPWQVAPRPDSMFHNEKLAKQFVTLDLAKANAHLDKAGLTKRDSSNMRLRPDGERLSILFEVMTGRDYETMGQLMARQFAKVGIDFQVRPTERSLWETRRTGNDVDSSMWEGVGGTDRLVILDPRWYMPFSHESGFAVAWAQWRPGGTTGEEPPAPARRQIELYETLRGTIDREKQAALMREILAIAAEEFWVIGLALPTAVEVGVTRTTMRNTPATMQGSWAYPDPAPLNPQQFFFAQG